MADPIPEIITVYFAAQSERDFDSLVALFADDAVVIDDGKTWTGAAEIRAWRDSVRRPMLERLRREVKAGLVSHVIVLRVDRISRSVRDLLELLEDFKRYGVAFVSVIESIDTSTSLGEFVLTLLGGVAQLERATIADRTTLALSHKRREGKLYSRVPFGWREGNDQALVAVPAEQKALSAAKKLLADGKSYQAIADYFTDHGIKPKGGGKWYPASARQVLMSKMALEVA